MSTLMVINDSAITSPGQQLQLWDDYTNNDTNNDIEIDNNDILINRRCKRQQDS